MKLTFDEWVHQKAHQDRKDNQTDAKIATRNDAVNTNQDIKNRLDNQKLKDIHYGYFPVLTKITSPIVSLLGS